MYEEESIYEFCVFFPDEMKASSVSCYGNKHVKMPNYDRLAKEGVRFENCIVQNPVCSPSRRCLMTGRYVHNGGHRTLWHLLRSKDSVMPDHTMNPLGMNSLNHYAYGAVIEWFYRVACGIKLREDAPGFTKVLIEPIPNEKIGWINCSVNTIAGLYKVAWKIEGDEVRYDIEIPFGREAYLKLPGENAIRMLSGTYSYTRRKKV